MKKIFTLIGLVLVAAMINGCNKAEKPEELAKVDGFDYGRIENGKYNNKFFGFELTLPVGWIVLNKDELKKYEDLGKKLVTDNDKNLKAIVDAMDITTAVLIAISNYEIGAAVDNNSNFTLSALSLKYLPGVKTGGDYLFNVRELLKNGQLKYDSMDTKYEKVTFGGREFYSMNASLAVGGKKIRQRCYAAIQNEFCIFGVASYMTDEQIAIIEKMMSSMKSIK